MPTPDSILDYLAKLRDLLFPSGAPTWFGPAVTWLTIAIIALYAIQRFAQLFADVFELWKEKLQPIFYDDKSPKRSFYRRLFARYIAKQLDDLNRREEWRDYRFSDLETEIEVESRQRLPAILTIFRPRSQNLRREPSLIKAIQRAEEQLVLLEGEPGSGKSVALRHVALSVAERASRSSSTRSNIAIYVNLKNLVRKTNERIDRELIRSFVLESINQIQDRDITEFLEAEFSTGLQQGSWLFLLDLFDEIPEILSSTQPDQSITQYTEAISAYFSGMNQCRGVVASRYFRGPAKFGWPQFRVLPLSNRRRRQLIRRSRIDTQDQSLLLGGLLNAAPSIQQHSYNPMFVALLCDYVNTHHEFPTTSFFVYESYISTRIARDAVRLQLAFGMSSHDLMRAAEAIAFCMTADDRLGLSPSEIDLRVALSSQSIELPCDLGLSLKALSYTKLGRLESGVTETLPSRFTFSHRRFQEFFSTRVALREPHRLPPRYLLLDGRWRETAVVLLQTQTPEVLSPLFSEVRRIMSGMVPDVETRPLDSSCVPTPAGDRRGSAQVIGRKTGFYPWPDGGLHLLSLLQDGCGGRLVEIPEDLRATASRVILPGWEVGCLADRRWAVEVAGILPEMDLTGLLRVACLERSRWIRSAAFLQCGRLSSLPNEVADGIALLLVSKAIDGTLSADGDLIEAKVMRLPDAGGWLLGLRMLRSVSWPEACWMSAVFAMALIGISRALYDELWPVISWSMIVFIAFSQIVSPWGVQLPLIRNLEELAFWRVHRAQDVAYVPSVWFALNLPFLMYSSTVPVLGGSAALVIALAVGYLGLWGPAVWFLTRRRRFVRRRWWLMLPPLFVIGAAPLIVSNWKILLKSLAVFLLVICVGGIPTGAFIVAGAYLHWYEWNRLIPVGAFVGVPVIGRILYLVARKLRMMLSDWRHLRRLMGSPATTWSAEEAVCEAGMFRTTEYELRFWSFARASGRISCGDADVAFIRRIALAVEARERERSLQGEEGGPGSAARLPAAVTLKSSGPDASTDLGLGGLPGAEALARGPALVDEVYLVLEHLESRRRSGL
jgi:hypothetical protein